MDNTDRLNQYHQLIIWRLIDGKPGHENQSIGLVNALAKQMHCEIIDIKVSNDLEALTSLMTATWGLGAGLPLPDLIVGAGHATHLHLLAAKRAYGGKTVVLMKPTLPVAWFDLCFIPEHDAYQGGGTYLNTKGVLNHITAKGAHSPKLGLIMIGGPSKHYAWDTLQLVAQVYELVKHNPEIAYTLTTSRRTPRAFVSAVKRIHLSNLTIVPFEETAKGWVVHQLANSAYAWVTEDSVSMVYEALTAQVAVGLLNMPVKRDNRVTRGLRQLIQQGAVTRFDFLQKYQSQLQPAVGFMESERCSRWMLQSWMQADQTPPLVLETQPEFN